VHPNPNSIFGQIEIRHCAYCQRPIITEPWGVWRSLCCSEECRLAFRRKRNRENMRAKRNQEREAKFKAKSDATTPCQECGLEMSAEYQRSDRRYCSTRCRMRALRRRKRLASPPKPRPRRMTMREFVRLEADKVMRDIERGPRERYA
jgi:hypothetical protein